MKINGKQVTAKSFAFDGCHKIYLCESKEDEEEAVSHEYELHPIAALEHAYETSCYLKFIHNWALDQSYVAQGDEAVFTYEEGEK